MSAIGQGLVSEPVDGAAWDALAAQLAAREATLLSLWAEGHSVYLAHFRRGDGDVRVARLAVEERRFPSVARHHLPALRLERAIQDLFGLHAEGIPDDRPWLDHGTWPADRPSRRADAAVPPAAEYKFLPVDGADLHEVPVGPVHAGIIEPGHFRCTVSGETVVRLEERLGYTHKGIQELMRGAPLTAPRGLPDGFPATAPWPMPGRSRRRSRRRPEPSPRRVRCGFAR